MSTTPLRIHLLGMPNAALSKEFYLDGFAQAGFRFAEMMKSLGHTVYIYGAEGTTAPCDEFIPVITDEERRTLLDSFSGRPNTFCEYQHAWIDERSPLWQLANPRIIREVGKRKKPRDVICQIAGAAMDPVALAHPDLLHVEYSIGYQGCSAPFRVFESNIWRHWVYCNQQIWQGRFFDETIPLFFDPSEFTFRQEKKPFALFVGRL